LHIPSSCSSRRFNFARLKPYFSTSVWCAFATQRAGPDHVRFGSKADIGLRITSALPPIADIRTSPRYLVAQAACDIRCDPPRLSVSRVSFLVFVTDYLRRPRPRVPLAKAAVTGEDVTQMVARLECAVLAIPVHSARPDANHRAPRCITISSARRDPKRHRRGERSNAQCQFRKGFCHTVPHWFPVVLKHRKGKTNPLEQETPAVWHPRASP
jgi:hypothetical protein